MNHVHQRITYVGGPTALLELGGLRLVTDPTFDASASEYPATGYTLRKDQSPAIGADDIVPLDVVLLSHDHHADNLDRAGPRVARARGDGPDHDGRRGPPRRQRDRSRAVAAAIVPLHFEGWEHFTESRADIERAFAEAGMTDRLRWLVPGQPAPLP